MNKTDFFGQGVVAQLPPKYVTGYIMERRRNFISVFIVLVQFNVNSCGRNASMFCFQYFMQLVHDTCQLKVAIQWMHSAHGTDMTLSIIITPVVNWSYPQGPTINRPQGPAITIYSINSWYHYVYDNISYQNIIIRSTILILFNLSYWWVPIWWVLFPTWPLFHNAVCHIRITWTFSRCSSNF